MQRKKKKTLVAAGFIYLLLTTGLWMFLTSYSNSHNRLSAEKVSPMSLDINGDKARLTVLKFDFSFSVSGIMPESRLYYVMYMTSPDELRLIFDAFSLINDALL